jgi:hypothetical protein
MKVLLCGVSEAKELLNDVFHEFDFKFVDPICPDIIESMSYMERLQAVNEAEEKEWNDEDRFVTTLSTIDILADMILSQKEFDRDGLLKHYDEAGKHLDKYDLLLYCQPSEYDNPKEYAEALRFSYILIGWMKTNIKPSKKFVAIAGSKKIREESVGQIIKLLMSEVV